jgi:ABC-type multidrug transport system fused ATPase/permease subunit
MTVLRWRSPAAGSSIRRAGHRADDEGFCVAARRSKRSRCTAVVPFGSKRISQGSLEVGALTAYIAYLMQILVAVMMTTFLTIMIPRAAACAERIQEVFAIAPTITAPVSPIVPPALTGVIELRGVEYRRRGFSQESSRRATR